MNPDFLQNQETPLTEQAVIKNGKQWSGFVYRSSMTKLELNFYKVCDERDRLLAFIMA